MDHVWIKEETLTAIGDAVRAKSGASGLLAPDDMLEALGNIKSSGKYLFSKKGMSQTATETSSSMTVTLVTPNTSIPSRKIRYSVDRPTYNAEKQIWELPNYTEVDLVNTDNVVPAGGCFVALMDEPHITYYCTAFNVGAQSSLGTYTKSMTCSYKAEAQAGSDVLGYGVADDLAKYPDGGWSADGYYWECVGRPVVPMIEFAILGGSYQAEAGMTWGDFINSEYNPTDGNQIASRGSNVIVKEFDMYVQTTDGTNVQTTDVIVDGYTYALV